MTNDWGKSEECKGSLRTKNDICSQLLQDVRVYGRGGVRREALTSDEIFDKGVVVLCGLFAVFYDIEGRAEQRHDMRQVVDSGVSDSGIGGIGGHKG